MHRLIRIIQSGIDLVSVMKMIQLWRRASLIVCSRLLSRDSERFDSSPCLQENNFFHYLFIQESPMTQRGTLDISRRRTVCVRDAWADRTGRKVSGSAALQCSCRPSYCAGPARASGAGIPTRRATCPSPWAVLVCHCWKKKEEHRRASQAWKEYCQKIPAHSERMDLTDPFFFSSVSFSSFS